MPNEHDRHVAIDYAHLFAAFAMTLFAIFFAVLVCWLVLSVPKTKLFDADNTVCASQPLVGMQCWHR